VQRGRGEKKVLKKKQWGRRKKALKKKEDERLWRGEKKDGRQCWHQKKIKRSWELPRSRDSARNVRGGQ